MANPEYQANGNANNIVQAAEIGRRTSLFTDEELKNARKHKKHKKTKIETCFQPEFFEVESSVVGNPGIFDHQSVIDPEKQLAKLHREFEIPRRWNNRDSLVHEDIGYLKTKLREEIGLPIARGKDPHVGDKFYKFLVKRIVNYDVFGIFTEFNDYKYNEPTDLDVRISQVKNYISEALSNNVGLRGKYMNYNEFVDIYNKEWGK